MRRHVLETSQWLPAPREETFAFFSDPRNLARITPLSLGFTLMTPGPIEMRAGARFEYRIRVRGLPLSWTSLIEVWEPNVRFVDVQVRGPYRLWRHEHRFEARDDGTWIGDRVEYELPLYPLGEVAHGLIVRPDLDRIFAFRHAATERLLARPSETGLSGKSRLSE